MQHVVRLGNRPPVVVLELDTRVNLVAALLDSLDRLPEPSVRQPRHDGQTVGHPAEEHLNTGATMYREMDMSFYLAQTEAARSSVPG